MPGLRPQLVCYSIKHTVYIVLQVLIMQEHTLKNQINSNKKKILEDFLHKRNSTGAMHDDLLCRG